MNDIIEKLSNKVVANILSTTNHNELDAILKAMDDKINELKNEVE